MKDLNNLVIDCSFTIPFFVQDEPATKSEEVFERSFAGEIELTVPSIWYYEVHNVLKTAVKRKRITDEDAGQAMKLIENLPVKPVNFRPDEYKLIFNRSKDFDLSFYDASYLFLSELKKAPIATLDKKLIQACKRAGIQVLSD